MAGQDANALPAVAGRRSCFPCSAVEADGGARYPLNGKLEEALREHLDHTDSGGLVELLPPPAEAQIVELSPQLVVEIDEGAVAFTSDVPSRKMEEAPDDESLLLGEGRDLLRRTEPPGFGATLRPYQRYGFGWLQAVTEEGFGALLADDMGLGKTVQALALLQANVTGRVDSREGDRAPISLVVAPPATIENWRHEVWSFAPALSPLVYHGPGRAQLLRDLRSGAVSETRGGATPVARVACSPHPAPP